MDDYDVAIVGGGPGGLSLSILLARKGWSVLLLEKEQYPFHRVCGEYISMESWEFLKSLGLDLENIKPSILSRLQVSGWDGKLLEQPLPLGGFGISRYRFDDELAKLAIQSGVSIWDNTRVNDISYASDEFTLHAGIRSIKAKVVVGTFGKRSNLDIRWKRPFTMALHN